MNFPPNAGSLVCVKRTFDQKWLPMWHRIPTGEEIRKFAWSKKDDIPLCTPVKVGEIGLVLSGPRCEKSWLVHVLFSVGSGWVLYKELDDVIIT